MKKLTKEEIKTEADNVIDQFYKGESRASAFGLGFVTGADWAQKQLLQQNPCTTQLLGEITRCRSEAIKKQTAWGNGMSEHAIEARAMIMLCDHLLGFVQ